MKLRLLVSKIVFRSYLPHKLENGLFFSPSIVWRPTQWGALEFLDEIKEMGLSYGKNVIILPLTVFDRRMDRRSGDSILRDKHYAICCRAITSITFRQ